MEQKQLQGLTNEPPDLNMHTPRNFWMKVWNREGGPSLWVNALQSVFLSICTPKPGKHLMRDHVSTLLKCFLFIPAICLFFLRSPFHDTFIHFSFFFGSTPIFPRLYRISYFLILEFLTGHVHQNKLLRLKKKKIYRCSCSAQKQKTGLKQKLLGWA